MFRIWGKIFKDNHLVRDMVYENGDTDINRTKKVFAGIHAFAEAFDLQQPIWLDKNINEFKRVDKTRFEQDNFIEQIDTLILNKKTSNFHHEELGTPKVFIKRSGSEWETLMLFYLWQ